MKKQILVLSAIAIAASFTWSSCKKNETAVSPPSPENEFLTTIKLVATNEANASDVVTATWVDLTPDDTNPPDTSKAVLNLKPNAVYDVQVLFLDETQSPAGDITAELKERQNYHLIFFQPTPISAADNTTGINSTNIPGTASAATGPYLNLHVTRTDMDANTPPLPIGLTDKFSTGAASDGNLEVVLRHQPNAKNGTYEPGSTDADVNFRISIH
jgi:hypothetical protein